MNNLEGSNIKSGAAGRRRVNKFRTDHWYTLVVHEAQHDPDVELGKYRDRVEVVFMVSEHGQTSDSDPPKACVSMYFKPGWIPNGRAKRLLKALAVPLPIPQNVDWKQLLVGRRIYAQFDPPPRADTWNAPRKVKPHSSYEQAKVPHAIALRSVIDVSPATIVGRDGLESAHPVVLHAPNGPIAARPSTELILEGFGENTIALSRSETCRRREQIPEYRYSDWHQGVVLHSPALGTGEDTGGCGWRLDHCHGKADPSQNSATG